MKFFIIFLFLGFGINVSYAQSIPANASPALFGGEWQCDRGYKKDNSQTKCVLVQIPENGELDYTGHNWVCKRGYKKDSTYAKCIEVEIPENSELDYTGHSWTCKRGFKKDTTYKKCDVVSNSISVFRTEEGITCGELAEDLEKILALGEEDETDAG